MKENNNREDREDSEYREDTENKDEKDDKDDKKDGVLENVFAWTVRVRADATRTLAVHARNHTLLVGDALSFRPTDAHPSAIELMLGAFAADLTATFRSLAAKRRLPLDALEFSATCVLSNPLIHVGVIGETGHPGIERIDGTLYVSSDVSDADLTALWETTLARSPLYNTLCNTITLSLRMQPTY